MVTHQLQVERSTGKVRKSKTNVLPLNHATKVVTTCDLPLHKWHFAIMSRNINTGMLSVTIVLLSSDTEKLTYEYDSTSLSESMIIDRIITT